MTRLFCSVQYFVHNATKNIAQKAHQILLCGVAVCSVFALESCVSARVRDFAPQAETGNAKTPPPIYVIGKKSITEADPNQLLLDVWKVEDEDYPKEMRVFARVLDSSGHFITNMAPPYGTNDYRKYWTSITEILEGDTVRIKDFTVQEFSDKDSAMSFALGLTLDHGGSMAGAVGYLQDAARMFVGMKFPNDRITIAKFDSKTKIETPLTADLRDLRKALSNEDLRGYGLYTALYDAMLTTAQQLAKTQASTPRAMIVFSDGEDNHSKANEADVYAFAKKEKIRIFPVAFGYANDTTLNALARATGGKYYRVRSKDEFAKVFRDIYESLRNYYQITYIPSDFNGHREGIITLDPRGKGGSGDVNGNNMNKNTNSDTTDANGRRGRGTPLALGNTDDANGRRMRNNLLGDGGDGKNSSGSKSGSGSGNDGSGNKQGSGSGNDGSGNKQGSGSGNDG
ncbi:MAG: VWA domain-containing protein, partial [Candidatus Kapaibacterium sp.]